MKKMELNKLMDMLEDVKKLDSMILLHRELDDSNFMVSQYEAKKARLISQVIDGLVSPSVQSIQSFSLIKNILFKYYPESNQQATIHDADLDRLAAAI